MLHPHYHHLLPGSLKSSPKDPSAPVLPSCKPFSKRMVIKSGRSPAHQNRSSLQDVKVHTSCFCGLLRSPFCALSTLWTYWSTFYSSNVPSSLCVRALVSVTDSRVTVSFHGPSTVQVNPNITSSDRLSPATLPTVFAHPSVTPSPNSISFSPKQVSLLDIKQGNNFRL